MRIIILIVLLLAVSNAHADSTKIREAGQWYAKLGEQILVDGPFYVSNEPYYVLDYVTQEGVSASLVYDPNAEEFVNNPELMRKVLATKDSKNLLLWDPLFYAIGNPELISLAAEYEIQNALNFGAYVVMTDKEAEQLLTFFEDYMATAKGLAEVARLTNSMLYPDDATKFFFNYTKPPPNIWIEVRDHSNRGHYSYEDFQKLTALYEKILDDYKRLALDLEAYSGGLPEHTPGETIRDKWGVTVTKETLLEQVLLAEKNGQLIEGEVGLRSGILAWPYEAEVKKADVRTGVRGELARRAIYIGGGFVVIVGIALYLRKRRKPPASPALAIVLMIGIAAAQTGTAPEPAQLNIPPPGEIMAQKVTDVSQVPLEITSEGVDEAKAREMLAGYPFLMKGEAVRVRGPYYYYGEPNYLFEVTRDGAPTGKGFLVSAENFRLVADQRAAFQLTQAVYFADLIASQSLYGGADDSTIEASSQKAAPHLADFLKNLTANIEQGKVLEREMVERPDYATVTALAKNYMEGFIMLQKIEQLTTPEEAKALTGGFSEKMMWLEGYSRAMRGLSAEGYLMGRQSLYVGRALIRLPLIRSLTTMGLMPSKGQLLHDLTSDFFYDNIYLWRLEKPRDPNLFARLAFKEGTFTLPSVVNGSLSGGG